RTSRTLAGRDPGPPGRAGGPLSGPNPKRALLAATAGLALMAPASATLGAQVPSELARVELARSRQCVGVIARVADVEERLAPLAARSRRLAAIAEAVALEERTVVDSLDASDPLEAQVRQWFAAD